MKTKFRYLRKSQTERLEAYFRRMADMLELYDEHWIHGDVPEHSNEGISYCRECAEKIIALKKAECPECNWIVDGGWGTEGDHVPLCEECGKYLDNSFTRSACNDALGDFQESGFDLESSYECHVFLNMIDTAGWTPWRKQEAKGYDREKKYMRSLHELCRPLLEKIDKQAAGMSGRKK